MINRGYGVGNYKLNFCIIDIQKEYLIENHLVCICHNKITDREQLLSLYEKIIISLKSPNTEKFINMYFGNNSINSIELLKIIPFYEI